MGLLHAACAAYLSRAHARADRATPRCTCGALRITSTLETLMGGTGTCGAATCTMSLSTRDCVAHREATPARHAWVVFAACTGRVLGLAKRVTGVVLQILGYKCQQSLSGLHQGLLPFCHPRFLCMNRMSAQTSPIVLAVQRGLGSSMAATMSLDKVQCLRCHQQPSTYHIRLLLEPPICHLRMLRIRWKNRVRHHQLSAWTQLTLPLLIPF